MIANCHRIFLNSLPKSGSNLVSRALDLAGIPYDRLGIAATLVLGNRFLLRQLVRRSLFERDPLIIGLEVQMPLRRAWLDRRLARVRAGGYVTGHANWSMGLENLLAAHSFKTVLVIRDPRDVLLSHSHYVGDSSVHFLNRTYRNLGIAERASFTLHGGRIDGLDVAPFKVMLNRIDSWIGRPGVEVVRFEDIVGPSGGGSTERQRNVLDTLSSVTGRRFDPAVMNGELFGHSHTFRKGRIGSAAAEFGAQELAEIEATLAPILRKWGYLDA